MPADRPSPAMKLSDADLELAILRVECNILGAALASYLVLLLIAGAAEGWRQWRSSGSRSSST